MAQAVRSLITAVFAFGLAFPAFADDGPPPAYYLARGQAALANGHVRIQQDTPQRVQILCASASPEYTSGTINACTLGDPDPRFPFFLIIIAAPQYTGDDFYTATLNHELGHVGGWPSNHPR